MSSELVNETEYFSVLEAAKAEIARAREGCSGGKFRTNWRILENRKDA